MDCGDRVCEMEYRLLPNCILYTDISEEKHCQYPCSTTNCATQIHNFIMCPTWTCMSKTTTTPSPPLSTLTPWPTSSSNCSSTICVPSLVFNGLFGIIILLGIAVFVYFYRRSNQQSLSAFYHSSTNPLFDAEAGIDYFENQRRPIIRNPSLRISERAPLIEPQQASNPRQESRLAGPAILTLSPNIQETAF